MRSKWTPTPEKYQLHKLAYRQSRITDYFTVNCNVIRHTAKEMEVPTSLRLQT
jgi:hypothetical protein